MDALQARVNGGAAEVEEAEEAPRAVSEPREPAPAPVAKTASVDASVQEQLADIRNAISSLGADIEVLRQEMRSGLVELAKYISRGSS